MSILAWIWKAFSPQYDPDCLFIEIDGNGVYK